MSLLKSVVVFLSIGFVCTGNDLYQDAVNKELKRLGFSNQEALNNNWRQGSIGHIGRTILGVPNEMTSGTVEKLTQALLKKCREGDHNDVIESLEGMTSQTKECIIKNTNVGTLGEDFQKAARTGDLSNFFLQFCKIWPNVHGCIKPIVSLVKTCLSDEESRIVDKTIEFTEITNNFLCENNANRMSKFYMMGGPQCMQMTGSKLQSCSENYVQERGKHDKSPLSLVPYDHKDCSDYQQLRHCIVKSMSQCQAEEPLKIVDEYLEIIEKKVCNSASTLAWFSFLNVLMLFVTYSYSKMF